MYGQRPNGGGVCIFEPGVTSVGVMSRFPVPEVRPAYETKGTPMVHPTLIAYACRIFAAVLSVFPDEFWPATFQSGEPLVSAAGTYVIVLLLLAYGHAIMYINPTDFIEMHMVYTAGFAILIALHWNALTTLGAALSSSTCGFILASLACEMAEKELVTLHRD